MTVGLVLLAGLLVAGGVVACLAAALPSTPRLASALARIEGQTGWTASQQRDQVAAEGTSEQLGAWLYRRLPFAITAGQRRRLLIQGKSMAEFYADKVVMAVVGAVMPAFVCAAISLLAGVTPALPVIVALIGLVTGFFVPDLLLLRTTAQRKSAAVEALLVYIDLVTLERLANASATQALHSAARISDVPLFRQLRLALDRARLEQQPPYGELRRLADQLELPELADLADIMQLDETGAALAGTLRARVRELRDAHLNAEQVAASSAAEGMTIYMTVPVLIFGLIFITPAVLRIVGGW